MRTMLMTGTAALALAATVGLMGCTTETKTVRRETIETVPAAPAVVERRTTVESVPASSAPMVVEKKTTTVVPAPPVVERRTTTTTVEED